MTQSFLSGIYFLVWWCWNFLYEHRWIIPKRVNATVVSVGNLTVGGTGKTPFTIFLAKHYQANGYTVGIVSRGYKGNYREAVALVSDGTNVLGSATLSGDEPMMMARRLAGATCPAGVAPLAGIPIAVSKGRYLGCQLLIEKFKVNLILLDDGFQHRRLHRDLNLLLIDTTEKNHSLLPKGMMREPLSAAKRANVVVLTRQDGNTHDVDYPFTCPILHTSFSPVALINLQTGDSQSLSTLKGEKVLAFCGIGNPDSFLKMLSDLGVNLCESIVFRDHYGYTNSDIKEIETKGKRLGVKYIITTEKDAIKIESLSIAGIDIFALRIEIGFKEPSTVWERHLNAPLS